MGCFCSWKEILSRLFHLFAWQVHDNRTLFNKEKNFLKWFRCHSVHANDYNGLFLELVFLALSTLDSFYVFISSVGYFCPDSLSHTIRLLSLLLIF